MLVHDTVIWQWKDNYLDVNSMGEEKLERNKAVTDLRPSLLYLHLWDAN
jgi:hypothetical protein